MQEVSEIGYRAVERAPRPHEEFDAFMTRTAREMHTALVDEAPFVTVITDPSCLRLITARSSSGRQCAAPYAVFLPSKRIVIKDREDPAVAARDIAADIERLSMYKAPLCEECRGTGTALGMSACPDCGAPVCDLCVVRRAVEGGTLAASMACDICLAPAPVAMRALALGARGALVGKLEAVWKVAEKIASSRGGAVVFAFTAMGRYGRGRIHDTGVPVQTVSEIEGDPTALSRLHAIMLCASQPARFAVFDCGGGSAGERVHVFDRRNVSGAVTGEGEMRWFGVLGADEFTRHVYGAIELACRRRRR